MQEFWYVGSRSLTRDRTQAPALGTRSINHWTAWEAPPLVLIQRRALTLGWRMLGLPSGSSGEGPACQCSHLSQG